MSQPFKMKNYVEPARDICPFIHFITTGAKMRAKSGMALPQGVQPEMEIAEMHIGPIYFSCLRQRCALGDEKGESCAIKSVAEHLREAKHDS